MKINLAWLADFVDLKVGEDELLERVNTQLGEIESVADLAPKYAGALIVKVVKVEPHPRADKLTVCLIDDARADKSAVREGKYVRVVCGAPNAAADMLAVWLPPGAPLPAAYGTERPERLSAKEIRGVLSQGMLASALELDIGPEGDEILEVKEENLARPDEYPAVAGSGLVGQSFAEAFDLQTKVIDIENKMFTRRPDCFGLLGVAREIAAITGSRLKTPDWYTAPAAPTRKNELLALDVKCSELVPRLRAVVIGGIKKVGPSDLRIRTRLASIDYKPVNNVVDATNYVMYVSGQPGHAFDYDKLLGLTVKGRGPLKLVVRPSKKGERLKLLNGKTLVFDQPAVVIATDKQPVALGGVMGGIETEVDAATKTVLLECANFDMYNLRRTTMHYGVFSEAATRFTRGQSLEQIPQAADRMRALITAAAGGQTAATDEFSVAGASRGKKPVATTAAAINRLLGSRLTAPAMADLLRRVGFAVETEDDRLRVRAPFWRTDIDIAEDIAEEIGRLNDGYATIVPELPDRPAYPAARNELLDLRTKIRRCLAARGANEALGYSFVSAAFLERSGQDPAASYHLANPPNADLEAYRQSLTPSLLAFVTSNRRLGHKDFALFEAGCVHRQGRGRADEDGLPPDLQRVALVCHRSDLRSPASYYTAKRFLDFVCRDLGLEAVYEPRSSDTAGSMPDVESCYDLSNSARVRVDGLDLGIVGLLDGQGACAGWEIRTDVLLQAAAAAAGRPSYRPLAKYPKSSQDLTLRLPLAVAYGQLRATLTDVLAGHRKNGWQTDLRPLSIFQPATDASVKNVSFRLTAWHDQKTARKDEVSAIVADLVRAAAKRHQARQVV